MNPCLVALQFQIAAQLNKTTTTVLQVTTHNKHSIILLFT